jgi:hypothetical protein
VAFRLVGFRSAWLGATDLRFHFLGAHDSAVYFVKPFDPVAAVTLVVITAVIGYAFGFVGAVIWNQLYRR